MRKSVRAHFKHRIMQLSTEISTSINARLKYLRISRQEFAEMMGVAPSSITKWLKGDHNFELRTLVKIEQVLKFELVKIGDKVDNHYSHTCFPCTISVNGKLIFDNTKKNRR